MDNKGKSVLADFWAIGINYKKTDAAIRGNFAINTDKYAQILALAPSFGVSEIFVLSTCNRTEIYGVAASSKILLDLLGTQIDRDKDRLGDLAYIKNGLNAAQHLFNVAAGLDSQLLGDYEIVGQVKLAAKFSKERGFIKSFMERLVNNALQASKAIKNETELSSGTVSVSFAAIQYIQRHWQFVPSQKIVLIGAGKIGKSTCRNLTDYLGAENVTLINRTADKAIQLATDTGFKWAPFEQLTGEVAAADIVLVATDAPEPIIKESHLGAIATNKLFIDLSIPYNVAPEIGNHPMIQVVNVDGLAKIKDETLQSRRSEVPKAQSIITKHLAEFTDWYRMWRFSPVLLAMKGQLHRLATNDGTASENIVWGDKIEKAVNTLAFRMRKENKPGCLCIETIRDFIRP